MDKNKQLPKWMRPEQLAKSIAHFAEVRAYLINEGSEPFPQNLTAAEMETIERYMASRGPVVYSQTPSDWNKFIDALWRLEAK